MLERQLRRAALLLCCCAAGCSTDTSGLARRAPTEASAGAGGGGAPATAGGGAGGAASGGSAGDTPEPDGPGALTIVHGLVDGGALFACLRDRQSGASIGGDTVQPAAGLSYASTLELPTSWDLEGADVDVNLFVATAAAWANSSCAALDAAAVDPLASQVNDAGAGALDAGPIAPPFPLEPSVPRRAGSVRFSPGTLRAGVRYALIAAGCTGPGAADQAEACGEPDASFGGAEALLVAEIAAEPVPGADRLGLQFVNASRAVERADVTLQNDRQEGAPPLGNDVTFGAVRPLRAALVAEPIGVELRVDRAQAPTFVEAWADTVTSAGADGDVLGHTYLLAYVGPLPTATTPGLAAPRFVLVRGR